MSYTAREIAFLRDMAAKGVGQKTASHLSRHFHSHFGLGHHAGRQYLFDEADASRARQMLANARIALEFPSEELRRADAEQNNPADEKSGTVAPHSDSIAIKTAHGRCECDGLPVASVGYQVITSQQASRIRADVLLVVENLESFRFLERNRWIDYQGKDVLAVFRGDRYLKADLALKLIDGRPEPVWAYFDFDPAGLGMASKLPRLQAILLPPNEESLIFAVREKRQFHLYSESLSQWRMTLDSDTRPLIQKPWSVLRPLKSGLSQEHMDTMPA